MSSEARPIRHRRADAVPSLSAEFSPLLGRIYAGRGVTSPDQIDYSLQKLLPMSGFRDLGMAALRLAEAVQKGEKLLVVGDYDADGATGVAVTLLALRGMYRQAEQEQVSYLVPSRFEFGYGLTPEIVEVAADQKPGLLVTVDNGIASCDGVARAGELGMEVIITDHHLPGHERPRALAVVNPNQDGCSFPAKSTAGVGVAFYLMLAVRARLRRLGWFDTAAAPDEPRLADLLDLVAIGTVADVVPLEYNNRILVDAGLRRIRSGQTRPGILALVREAGCDRERFSTSDISFRVAPRLNAAGRLSDMSIGIECLLADDQLQANQLAAELGRLNQERKDIEREMRDEAEELIKSLRSQDLPPVIVLHDENWHHGLLGILASRLSRRHDRPAVVLAPEAPGSDLFRGSARSVAGLHIRDALDAAATRNPGLLEKFGGHAMAAGLTISRGRLDDLQAALTREAERFHASMEEHRGWLTDGPLAEDELTVLNAQSLELAGPFGQDFPPPRFDNVFELLSEQVARGGHLRLRLRLPGNKQVYRAIWFNQAAPTGASRLHLVYRLSQDTYLGSESLSLVVEHGWPARKRA